MFAYTTFYIKNVDIIALDEIENGIQLLNEAKEECLLSFQSSQQLEEWVQAIEEKSIVQDLSKIARPSIAPFKESGALLEKPKGRKTLVP